MGRKAKFGQEKKLEIVKAYLEGKHQVVNWPGGMVVATVWYVPGRNSTGSRGKEPSGRVAETSPTPPNSSSWSWRNTNEEAAVWKLWQQSIISVR